VAVHELRREDAMSEPDIPHGFCHCGCGQRTRIAPRTRSEAGWSRGEPLRYLHGHSGRKSVRYIEVDLGYTSPCWIWQLAIQNKGYGVVGESGRKRTARMRLAHVVYYEQKYGPVPEGFELDHLCHSPKTCYGKCPHRACINPDHQEPVTHAVNLQRGKKRGGTVKLELSDSSLAC
jgi:hypothetical protein